VYNFLVWNSYRRRPLARPKCRCVDGTGMDLGVIFWGWIGFDWLRTRTVASCCECGDELSGIGTTDLVCDL
jgi:hypothetical protein